MSTAPSTSEPPILSELSSLDSSSPEYATQFVDLILDAATQIKASDVHLQPTSDGLDLRWRLDGVLQPVGVFPRGDAADVVSRMKVLAELLTYRTDVPQEGRIRDKRGNVEIRVSTFPTLHGERAVVRMFAAQGEYLHLRDLGLPDDIFERVSEMLVETSGAILITGPAGSGKTTTAYACLRELVAASAGGKSIVSLEDPIESAVDGVSQSRVNPTAGFDLASGLRSLMRQDPEAIMVGEIRDQETAEIAIQAALTGHLVLSTMHTNVAAGAVTRCLDMGVQSYKIAAALVGVIAQRLVRTVCPDCRAPYYPPAQTLDLIGYSGDRRRQFIRGEGCRQCFDTGFRGRTGVYEVLLATREIRELISRDPDLEKLRALNQQTGGASLLEEGLRLAEEGRTSLDEVMRVALVD